MTAVDCNERGTSGRWPAQGQGAQGISERQGGGRPGGMDRRPALEHGSLVAVTWGEILKM